MCGRRLLFDTLYRLGRPIWDTPPPEQLRDAVEGAEALSPGHALDVGCGTGANVIYLATHGWRASGVDFSAAAIRSARRAADGVTGATFLEGDVTKLSQLPLEKPIDLVLDIGCYHSLPDDAKPAYVAELAKVMAPGTPLMMWEGIRIKPGEIPDAFSPYFSIAHRAQELHDQPKTVASHHSWPLVLAVPPLTSFSQRRPVGEFHRTQWPAWLTHDGSLPCRHHRPLSFLAA